MWTNQNLKNIQFTKRILHKGMDMHTGDFSLKRDYEVLLAMRHAAVANAVEKVNS